MSLSNDQLGKVCDVLDKSKRTRKQCQDCDSTETLKVGGVFECREYTGGYQFYGSMMNPMIALFCVDCGSTAFVSAIVLGIVDPRTGKFTL